MDVHAQRVGIRQFLAPDTGFQFLPCDHRRRCFHQRLQDLQRGRVELQQLALAPHFQGVQVELQLAGIEHARLRALATTGKRIEAHVHFLQRERLDQVVVGAGIEAGQLVLQRVARGQHQHRGLLARLVAQLAADFQAVHAGQVEIQHDRIEFVDHRQVQAGDAIGSEIDRVTAILQIVAEIGGDVRVVLDDQDAHAVFLACRAFAM